MAKKELSLENKISTGSTAPLYMLVGDDDAEKLDLVNSFIKMIDEELKLDERERIQVVSILTPNFLHYPMAKKLLENNFNVICGKYQCKKCYRE